MTPEDGDPVALYERRRARLQRARWFALAGVLCLGLVGLLRLPIVGRVGRGEIDWSGQRSYVPPHRVDADRLRSIDHARVHAELLPRWVIAVSREARGVKGHRETRAYEALHAAVEADPNLTDLLVRLRDLVRSREEFERDPARALYLIWAWSRYLEQHEVHYHVDAVVHPTQWGPMLATMVYVTNANAWVWAGTQRHRVRLGTRVDGTNARELYLGAAGSDGAIVVTDRLAEFALTDLWPLLDPNIDGMLGDRRPFAPAVRVEAAQRLEPSDFELLRRTAYSRWQIVTTLAAIHERSACGSTFQIHDVPWDGIDAERSERLRHFAETSKERSCPAITPQEIELLEVASTQLQKTPNLGHAIGALTAWAAEHVAMHEGRHLADDAAAEHGEPLACVSCPDTMGASARAELSGYLASMAWSSSPATAMYQACRALHDDQRMLGGALPRGPHAEAMRLLFRRLGPFCDEGPPEDLAPFSRHLEAEMLGRSTPMRLGDDFPRRLPVD